MKVYLMDDNWDRRVIVRQMLKKISNKIRIIGEERVGTIAIPLIRRLEPDLLFVDYYTYLQYRPEFVGMSSRMILVSDFPMEQEDPPLAGSVCCFLLTAELSADRLERVLRRFFPAQFDPQGAVAPVSRSREEFLRFSAAEYGDAFSLFILRLPEGAAKADAVEYLEKAAAACGGAGPRRLMEYDAECAVLLQQSVSSDSKRFRELASRLDALELPRDTHYLFYERLNGLEEVALAVESLAQVQEQCFFALGTYVSLHLPSPSPKPVSQEELEERIRELHKRLYAGNQFGFITQLKELYCGLLAEHRHLPSCRVAHELIRDVWFSYSEKQEGGLGHDFPMTFEEASSLNDLYADISNHFILAFNHSAADFSDIISCAVQFLQEHCAEPIALAETARFLDVSESYLSRRFHRETGRTLVDYLNHIRIDRARLLLSSSGHLRVHRVSELCGFSNAHYFALRFKKEVGMTPLEFQKRMRAYLYQGNQEARI